MLANIIKTLLGVGNGASTASNTQGIINHAVALPSLAWLVLHADQQLHFTTSLGFLALLLGIAYVVLEFTRRSRAKQGGENGNDG